MTNNTFTRSKLPVIEITGSSSVLDRKNQWLTLTSQSNSLAIKLPVVAKTGSSGICYTSSDDSLWRHKQTASLSNYPLLEKRGVQVPIVTTTHQVMTHYDVSKITTKETSAQLVDNWLGKGHCHYTNKRNLHVASARGPPPGAPEPISTSYTCACSL